MGQHHFSLKIHFHPKSGKESPSLLPHQHFKSLVVNAVPIPLDREHCLPVTPKMTAMTKKPMASQASQVLPKQSTGPTASEKTGTSLPRLSSHKFPQIPKKL